MSDTGSTHDAQLGPRKRRAPAPASRTGVDLGIVIGCLIVLGSLAVTVVAVVLLHSSPVVTFQGDPFDSEGSTGAPSVTTDIRCVPAVGGTDGYAAEADRDPVSGLADESIVEPSGGLTSEREERGIGSGDISVLCAQARTARVAHAGELGFVAILLLALGIPVTRSAWRRDSS